MKVTALTMKNLSHGTPCAVKAACTVWTGAKGSKESDLSVLITPEYLTPYLSYIKNNKRLFRTATENEAVLGMDKSYDMMFRHVFTPILDRYGVLPQDRPYIMAFYIRGLMAIISEWLKNDCADSITYVTGVIQQCVKMPQSETMKF